MHGCMDALSPLRQMWICILNNLNDWLILAQSQAVLASHKTLLLSHLDCLGLRVNFAKSILSPSQRVSFLGTVIDSYRRKVVTTDASNKCWGALCKGKQIFGLWSEEESGLHINCLEMLTVCQACQFFLPDIWGHHVLIRSDRRSVVSYLNHEGGLVSKRLCTLANDLLVWAQNNLRSLKMTHVPGKMNQGADILSRNNVSSEEWKFHPLSVKRICEIFRRAQVDLFASKDNSHCPIFSTWSTDALAHELPSLPLYAFSPEARAPSCSTTTGTQEQRHKLILIAPPLKEPTMGVGVIPAAGSSLVADPLDPLALSSERHDMAYMVRVMSPACVASQRVSFVLPEHVLNTMAEARAPSSRCLYTLKWAIFLTWWAEIVR